MIFFQEVIKSSGVKIVVGLKALLSNHKASYLDFSGLKVLFIDAVVTDEGIGWHHNLPGIGGVGQHLLIAGHAGVEHHLPVGISLGAEGVTFINRAIF
ncbi:hypothetical protein ES703_123439 [subsurface metagenome]